MGNFETFLRRVFRKFNVGWWSPITAESAQSPWKLSREKRWCVERLIVFLFNYKTPVTPTIATKITKWLHWWKVFRNFHDILLKFLMKICRKFLLFLWEDYFRMNFLARVCSQIFSFCIPLRVKRRFEGFVFCPISCLTFTTFSDVIILLVESLV